MWIPLFSALSLCVGSLMVSCRVTELWSNEPITETAEHVIDGQRDGRGEGWTEKVG